MALNTAVTDVLWSPNFSGGRPAGDPNVIFIHHWGVDGQSHQGVVNYLASTSNHGASAHYVASAGRVTQMVHDFDRAWHAGPDGNPRGIGIECRPEMSAADFETVAQLVAAIRSEWGNLPLKGHRDVMSTACPGRWYKQLDELDARARQIAAGTTSKPTANKPVVSKPAAKPSVTKLAVDGYLGALTVGRLQQVLGTTADGVISGQDRGNAEYLPALSGVEYTSAAPGSLAVIALQRKLGVTPDGHLGPKTIRAWQRKLGVKADGYLGITTGKAIQKALNAGKAY